VERLDGLPSAFDWLTDLLRALDAEGVRYVLFGGQAVNLHRIPRFTEDIDLFVRPIDRADAADLKAKFRLEDD
jgi:hypothetical protein